MYKLFYFLLFNPKKKKLNERFPTVFKYKEKTLFTSKPQNEK